MAKDKKVPSVVRERSAEFYRQKLDAYQYEADIELPAAKTFMKLFKANPEIPRDELAESCEVARQTVQQWINKIVDNEPIRGRGKPRKFSDEPSIALSVRLPASINPRLKELAKKGDTTVRGVLEKIIVNSPDLRS